MKKISLFLVSLICVTFIGCNNTSEGDSSNISQDSPKLTAAESIVCLENNTSINIDKDLGQIAADNYLKIEYMIVESDTQSFGQAGEEFNPDKTCTFLITNTSNDTVSVICNYAYSNISKDNTTEPCYSDSQAIPILAPGETFVILTMPSATNIIPAFNNISMSFDRWKISQDEAAFLDDIETKTSIEDDHSAYFELSYKGKDVIVIDDIYMVFKNNGIPVETTKISFKNHRTKITPKFSEVIKAQCFKEFNSCEVYINQKGIIN